MTADAGFDAYRARLDGAAITTFILACLAVVAKLWSKRLSMGWRHLWWDDWLAVATLAWTAGFFFIAMIALRPLLGQHVGTDIPVERLVTFATNFFAGSLIYVCAIAFIKFTILALYWKLFSVTFRVPIALLLFSVLLWMVILIFVASFSCNPPRAQWDITIQDAKCLGRKPLYLGGSLPNVILDVVIVLMPIRVVWMLGMPLAQRVIVASMFSLGIFICIVSIIRLSIVMSIDEKNIDFTYNTRDFVLWSAVEVNIGLVCACLPSLRPLLHVIGLDRIFSSHSRGSQAAVGPAAVTATIGGTAARPHAHAQDPRKMSRVRTSSATGIFGTLAGLAHTRADHHEDVFHMIDSTDTRNGCRDNHGTAVELQRTSIYDTDGDWRGGSPSQKELETVPPQQDWNPITEDGKRCG